MVKLMRLPALPAGLLGAIIAAAQTPPPVDSTVHAEPIVNGQRVPPRPDPDAPRTPDPEADKLLTENPDHKNAAPPHDIYGNPLGPANTSAKLPPSGQ